MSQNINQISINNSNYYYKNFINSCKSNATKYGYRNGLSYFMDYLKIQPKEEDYASLINGRDIKIIQADIIDWITHMKDIEKKSAAAINLYVSGVYHFYKMNDIVLNKDKINAFKPEFRNVVEDKPYTREQIKLLLDRAEPRDRCIILLLSSSGVRVGSLEGLQIGDLTPIDKYGIYQVKVYRRSKAKYVTFTSTEFRKEWTAYLQYRKRYGEHITDKSPVFRTTFNRNDQFKAANKIKPLSTPGIKIMINDLLNTTGVRPSKKMTEGMTRHDCNRTSLMEVHGFRKYFSSTCINDAGMSEFYTDTLLGHNTQLTGRYTKVSPEELLEGNDKNLGYISAMEHLIICEENRLRREVETLKVERSCIEELKRDLDGLKSFLATSNDTFSTTCS